MSCFAFALQPMDQVEPWGEEGQRQLHWFALTLGFYVLQFDGGEAYRYRQEALDELGWNAPGAPEPLGFERVVDYQVARLFQDLRGLMPSILEPIPLDVAQVVANDAAASAFQSWLRSIDSAVDPLEPAWRWWSERCLDGLHLVAGPDVYFWRLNDVIHIRCDNRNRLVNGVRIWSSDLIHTSMPLAAFLRDVEQFGTSFLDAMEERVRSAEQGWHRPHVQLDVPALRAQQDAERRAWADALGQKPRTTDWTAVRRALKDARP